MAKRRQQRDPSPSSRPAGVRHRWETFLVFLVFLLGGIWLAWKEVSPATSIEWGTRLKGIEPAHSTPQMGEDPRPILQWNEAFVEAIRKNNTPPCLGARNLAMLHLALDRALNRMRPRFHELVVQSGQPVKAEMAEGFSRVERQWALHAAALTIGSGVFAPSAPEFENLFQTETNGLPRSPKAVQFGTDVAQEILKERENDGATTTIHYIPKTEPGAWRRTAPQFRPPETPQKANTRPFVLQTSSQFRPDAPPDLASEAFRDPLNEVRRLGAKDSDERTPDQSLMARFWSDFSYTCTPPGHWNEIARLKIEERALSGHDAARLLAQLNIAMADAAIAAWDCKFHYNFWRPETALHSDGEKDWVSYLESPSHPEYVSGHGAISGAAATVLGTHLPLRRGEPLKCFSDSEPGVSKEFVDYWDCAEEIAASRVFGGIHYRFSGNEGLKLGRSVADWCIQPRGDLKEIHAVTIK